MLREYYEGMSRVIRFQFETEFLKYAPVSDLSALGEDVPAVTPFTSSSSQYFTSNTAFLLTFVVGIVPPVVVFLASVTPHVG